MSKAVRTTSNFGSAIAGLCLTSLCFVLASSCLNTGGNQDPEPQPAEPEDWRNPGGPSTPTPSTPSPAVSPDPEPSQAQPDPNDAGGGTPETEPSETDRDGDTIDDVDDNCIDAFNPLQSDLDLDGIGNECDPDIDNDGSLNADDCEPLNASISPLAEEIFGNVDDENCDGLAPSYIDAEVDCSSLDCAGGGVDALLCAMELCYPEFVLNAFTASPSGDTITTATESLTRFGDATNDLAPYLGSYTYIGTGASDSNHQQALPGLNSVLDPFSVVSDPIYDVVEVAIRMIAPPGVGGFAIDYIFFSQEYEEYIGTEYNDKFYMVLNAPQTTGGVDKIINFTDCSDPASYSDFTDPTLGAQCYIAINTAFSEPCSAVVTDISGTGFECAADGSSSGMLTTTWPIEPGEAFQLTFHVHDTSDQFYDSAVLLDHFRWVGEGAKAGTE